MCFRHGCGNGNIYFEDVVGGCLMWKCFFGRLTGNGGRLRSVASRLERKHSSSRLEHTCKTKRVDEADANSRDTAWDHTTNTT